METICKICKTRTSIGQWIHIKKPNEIYSHIKIKYWFCKDCIDCIKCSPNIVMCGNYPEDAGN